MTAPSSCSSDMLGGWVASAAAPASDSDSMIAVSRFMVPP